MKATKLSIKHALAGFIILSVILFLSGFISIAQDNDQEPFQPKQKAKPFGVDDITKLEKNVSKLRGLKFKNSVKVGMLSKKELRKKMMDSFDEEESNKDSGKVQKALVKFGLIPAGVDLSKLMLDIYSEQIGGFYDPREKELFVIKPEEDEDLPMDAIMMEKMYGISYYSIPAIHELTHALQDQNYDILTLPKDGIENDDLSTAVTSLIEGDASYIMYDYIFRKMGRDLSLMPSVSGIIGGSTGGLLDEAPAYIKEGLMFPYSAGFEFVHKIKSEKGWDAINKMYYKLPASTEQILHPEKYSGPESDYPMIITMPDVANFFPNDRYELLLRDCHGEFSIGIMIREFLPNIKSKDIAEGWDGDRHMTFELKAPAMSVGLTDTITSLLSSLRKPDEKIQKEAEEKLINIGMSAISFLQKEQSQEENKPLKNRYLSVINIIRDRNTSLIWFTTWDSVKDAKEFFEVYAEIIQKKYSSAKLTGKDDSDKKSKIAWKDDNNIILMERKEKDILIMETIPGKIADGLSALIWKEVKKEELKKVNRVEPPKKKPEDKKK